MKMPYKPSEPEISNSFSKPKTRPRPLQAPILPLPVSSETRYDESGHEELWKNRLAEDLNKLMDLAKWLNSHKNDWKNAKLIYQMTATVAQFMEIRPA